MQVRVTSGGGSYEELRRGIQVRSLFPVLIYPETQDSDQTEHLGQNTVYSRQFVLGVLYEPTEVVRSAWY